MTTEMSAGFLNDWNSTRDHREKIYISYDSTNKNCQAGEIEIIEYGHANVDVGAPIFNYAIAYDTTNRETSKLYDSTRSNERARKDRNGQINR